MSRLPEGNYAIILLPLTEDRELDLKGLSAEIEYAISRKLSGIVFGSNSEFPYLTPEEKAKVIKHSAELIKGRIALVAGIMSFGTKEALEFAQMAKSAGCDSVMVTLPIYYDLDFESVKRHYDYLARNAGLEITFYYVPDCSGLALRPEDIAELVSIPGINSMKLTVINREFVNKTIQLCWDKDCRIFIGTGLLLYEGLQLDAKGCFCPLNLIAPEDTNAVIEMFSNRKLEQAFQIQEKIRSAGVNLSTGLDTDYETAKNAFMAIYNAPYSSALIRNMRPPYPILKEALRLKGIPISTQVRLPYQRIREKQSEWVKKVLKDHGWLNL